MRSSNGYEWVPSLIGRCIWLVLVIVARGIVLSLRGVQDMGFVIKPFASEIYPFGLLWSQVIDAIFLTILVISLISFGGFLKDFFSLKLSRLPRLGNIAFLATVIGAVTVGFIGYDDLLRPPLAYQEVEWVYNLIFWLITGGLLAITLYEVARTAYELSTGQRVLREKITISSAKAPESAAEWCPKCGNTIGPSDVYCRRCGTKVRNTEVSDKKVPESPVIDKKIPEVPVTDKSVTDKKVLEAPVAGQTESISVKRRPAGLIVVAIYAGVSGVLGIVLGIQGIMLGGLLWFGLINFLSVVLILLSVLALVVAYGLLTL